MSIIKLNIGLTTNTGTVYDAGVALKKALQYLDVPVHKLHSLKITRGEQEDTLVIALHTDLPPRKVRDAVFALAISLEQDCIAYRFKNAPFGKGYLVGPKAARWGIFDPEKFVE